MNQLALVAYERKVDWNKVVKTVAPILGVFALVILLSQFVAVDYSCADIWTKGQNTAKEIYTNVSTLANYVAGAMFAIAMLFALFSKDQKKIDAALDWAKKIVLIWLVLRGAGWLFQYGRELTSGAPNIFG